MIKWYYIHLHNECAVYFVHSVYESEFESKYFKNAQFRYQKKRRDFYAPGLKGPPGASRNLIASLCLSAYPPAYKISAINLGDDAVTKFIYGFLTLH